MRLLYRRCAGIDVHKKSVTVCIRKRARGKRDPEIEEAVFGTFTQDLERLREWLRKHRVKHVAMESTGVYWIPVWNILETSRPKLNLLLVNPATVRALQGNKTDRIDARRIAEFLQYGLLRGSFIPPQPIRHLRELTRMRVHIQQDRNRVVNRIARLLETVNIKLGSVATNIVGTSGRDILRRLAEGTRQQPEELAQLARTQLRAKIPELILALDGRPDEHFRWMLTRLLRKLEWLDAEVAAVDEKLCEHMQPYEELIRRLCTIPGVDVTTARVLIAELGTDMTQFPDAAHAASWAGLCPGNAESGGKRFSGRTRKGDRYLRRILVQSAWGAARTRNCFYASLFHRIAHRRGMKKAAVAVAHRLLKIAFAIMRDGTEYRERGGDHFDRRNPEKTARKLVSRLERIGMLVEVTRPLQKPEARKIRREPAPPGECRKCWNWGLKTCIHVRGKCKTAQSTSSSPANSEV